MASSNGGWEALTEAPPGSGQTSALAEALRTFYLARLYARGTIPPIAIEVRAPVGARPSEDQEDDMARRVTVQSLVGMKAETTVGPHRVILDAPPEAGGGDEGPSPAEMLLGAIGA